jgi:nucleotidyltransferase/DNA polymerase involved in DNA repair
VLVVCADTADTIAGLPLLKLPKVSQRLGKAAVKELLEERRVACVGDLRSFSPQQLIERFGKQVGNALVVLVRVHSR